MKPVILSVTPFALIRNHNKFEQSALFHYLTVVVDLTLDKKFKSSDDREERVRYRQWEWPPRFCRFANDDVGKRGTRLVDPIHPGTLKLAEALLWLETCKRSFLRYKCDGTAIDSLSCIFSGLICYIANSEAFTALVQYVSFKYFGIRNLVRTKFENVLARE